MNSSRRLGIFMSAILVLALAGNVSAEWDGSGELGLVFARGNSDTDTLNTKLKLGYTNEERWSNTTELSFLRSETEGELDASRFVFDNNTDYSLSDDSYVTGVGRYDRDRFSSFEFQASLAVGYGRDLIDNERQTFSIEAGPGVRYTEARDSGETETDLIGRAAADYRLKISDNAELTNESLVETGSSNTFLENELSLTVAINDSISLKTALSVRHNTNVEPEREKTDYLSTVNLVYSFL